MNTVWVHWNCNNLMKHFIAKTTLNAVYQNIHQVLICPTAIVSFIITKEEWHENNIFIFKNNYLNVEMGLNLLHVIVLHVIQITVKTNIELCDLHNLVCLLSMTNIALYFNKN